MEPQLQPKQRYYLAKGAPEKGTDKSVEAHLSIGIGCPEEVAKELIGEMLMRLKVRYLQLFHAPKEYQWFIPQKAH